VGRGLSTVDGKGSGLRQIIANFFGIELRQLAVMRCPPWPRIENEGGRIGPRIPLTVKLKSFPDGLSHVWNDGLIPQADKPVATGRDVIDGAGHEGRDPERRV